jgi:hypothetical protein
MNRTKSGFEAEILINSTESLNVAFKDSADCWIIIMIKTIHYIKIKR